MKYKYLIIITLLTLCALSVSPQDPPPPPGGGHGMGGNQSPGGSAPIGSGLILLISMGALYGTGKTIQSQKKNNK
jgi:hypothetical protein